MSDLGLWSGPQSGYFDVVIIGSGPAGVAIAERLYEKHPVATIAMIERGPLLLRRHYYNSGGSIFDRDRFFERHQLCPWDGDLSQGGALLPCLGGRGIVGGSQLHRHYSSDFTLWPLGVWEVAPDHLSPYFADAETRLLGLTRSMGSSQDYASLALAQFGAQHPPCQPRADAALGRNDGFPHRSSVERIIALHKQDLLTAQRRLHLMTDTIAIELVASGSQREHVTYVRCMPSSGRSDGPIIAVYGTVFVLAASPVESARLVLVSGLGEAGTGSSATGRYLAEHIYCRGYLDVSSNAELGHGPINIFVPPPQTDLDHRYQVELRTTVRPDDSRTLLRVTGSAAMDPNRENRITVSSDRVDEYGVPKALSRLTRSLDDERRTQLMLTTLDEVASSIAGRWLIPPILLPCGASYHEAGTLRNAAPGLESATTYDGLLLGSDNVFVGDGAAFASVGAANPILTLTAMGYRLGDHLARILNSSGPSRVQSRP